MALVSVTIRPTAPPRDTRSNDQETTRSSQWPHHPSNCRSYRFGISVTSLFRRSSSSTDADDDRPRDDDAARVPAAFVLRRDDDDDGDVSEDAPLRLVRERLVIRRPPDDATGLHRDLREGDAIVEINGVEEPTFASLYAAMVRREAVRLTLVRGGAAAVTTTTTTTDAKKATQKRKNPQRRKPPPPPKPARRHPYPTLSPNETLYPPAPAPSLPPGWTQRLVSHDARGNPKRRPSLLFYSPSLRIKFRSRKRALRFVELVSGEACGGEEIRAWEWLVGGEDVAVVDRRGRGVVVADGDDDDGDGDGDGDAANEKEEESEDCVEKSVPDLKRGGRDALTMSHEVIVRDESPSDRSQPDSRKVDVVEEANAGFVTRAVPPPRGEKKKDDDGSGWTFAREGVLTGEPTSRLSDADVASRVRENRVGSAETSDSRWCASGARSNLVSRAVATSREGEDDTDFVSFSSGARGGAVTICPPWSESNLSIRAVATPWGREDDTDFVSFSSWARGGTEEPASLSSESNIQSRAVATSCYREDNRDFVTSSTGNRGGTNKPCSQRSEASLSIRAVAASRDRVSDACPVSRAPGGTDLGLSSPTPALYDLEKATREASVSQKSAAPFHLPKMEDTAALEDRTTAPTDTRSAMEHERLDLNHSIDSIKTETENFKIASDEGVPMMDDASFLPHPGSSFVKIEDEIQSRVEENVSVSEQSFVDRQFVQEYPQCQSDVDFDCRYDGNEDDCSVDSSSSSCSSSSSSSSSLSSSSSSSSSSLSSSDMNEESIKTQSTITTQNIVPPIIQQTNETRKRPVPTAAVSRSANSTPTLTSSTPQTQPNNELHRLWPDPSDVIKALTRWMPPIAIERAIPGRQGVILFTGAIRSHPLAAEGPLSGKGSGSNSNVNPMLFPLERSTRDGSKAFKNADDMLEAYAYPLINEGLCSLNGDYHSEKLEDGRWDRQTYKLVVTNLTEVSPIFRSKSYFTEPMTMYEVQFSLKGPNKIPPNSLSELYAMHFPPWKTTKFGIVAHDFPTSISFGRSRRESTVTLKLWVCVVEEEEHAKNTGWITRKEFKMLLHPYRKNPLDVNDNAEMTLLSVGSTINIVRQFEALKSLPHLKPHLQKAIFTSNVSLKIPSQSSRKATRPTSVPLDVWRSLEKTNNPYQLKSISDLLSGSCLENLSLIQGPPGTGKSSTIVGLVSALLSGKAPLPGSRQSRCLIHPGKTMGATLPEVYARNRILICATTNQAVDSLAWKIKNQSLGTSGKVGDFKMARFGSLPWEGSRDKKGKRPEVLSEMERFLYDINVDVKACNGYDDYANGESEEEWDESWTPPENKRKKKKRKRYRGAAQLRSEILSSCNVVLATLSGAGSKAFIEAVCRKDNKVNSEFRAVILDEACQSSEPESLIPFKFNPTTVTLVGDPQQLPVLTLSGSSFKYNIFERSLFERLQNLNWPTILLREQYRMHESIAAFPSQEFYQGQLITSNNVKRRPVPAWASNPCFGTLAFWDSNGSAVTRKGHGFTNKDEAKFITRILLTTFAQQYLVRSNVSISVGIISFYKDQVKLLQDEISSVPVLRDNTRLNVKVATVDGFQGSECDIIILSCVRSHDEKGFSSNIQAGKSLSGVGFLKDCRRVNVALTRAKCSLWIVGNSEVLKTSPLWSRLIAQLEQRNVLGAMGNFRDVLARYKASRE